MHILFTFFIAINVIMKCHWIFKSKGANSRKYFTKCEQKLVFLILWFIELYIDIDFITEQKECQKNCLEDTNIKNQRRTKDTICPPFWTSLTKVNKSIIHAYKLFKYLVMKSEELEVDILKMQNREMSIKIQYYRTENQELKSKN